MNEKQAIDGLGGPAVVAKRYGYSNSRVCNWIVRGIPSRVLLDDKRLARALKSKGYQRIVK